MAIQHRPERRSPWRVYWRNPFTGKMESESYQTQKEAEKADSLVKHRLKYEREDFRPAPTSEREDDTITLEKAYFLYLKEKNFADESLKWSTTSMKPCLQELGSLSLESITRKNIEDLKTSLLTTGIKPTTARGRLSVLRTVLRWSVEKGLLTQCPLFPRLPPAHYQHIIPPTPFEVAQLLAVAPPHLQRVILIGAQLGVRVGPSELLKLRWGDVDIMRGLVRVQAAKKRPDQPWREVPLRTDLLEIVKQWAAEDSIYGIEYVISYKGQPVKSIKTAWLRALKASGIERHFRPYDLRHTFATEAIAAGVDVGTVAQLMGHSSASMLLSHYQHVADAQKRAAVEAMPRIPCMPNFVCPKK